jgi:GT2 family glycosyltransferase
VNVAVIIVNWRNERETLRCAGAVRSWSTLKPELIVVDNESTIASREALAGALDPHCLILSETNLGYGGGNNLGIKQALSGRRECFLLLNGDAEISEVAVTGLLTRLEANAAISILGPVIHERQPGGVQCLIGGKDIARSVSTRIAADAAALTALPDYPLNAVDYVPGAVFLARRTVFEQIGLLDERYFFSGEIADFCKRASAMGLKSYVDLAVEAQHDARKTPQQLRETMYAYYSLRNRMLYARKHYPAEMVKHLTFWTGVCMVESARALGKGKVGKARAILLALAHGYINRSGNQNAALV